MSLKDRSPPVSVGEKSVGEEAGNGLAHGTSKEFSLGAPISLGSFDDEEGTDDVGTQEKIHIRIQQRNGRKSLTTLQGLPKEYDPKKLLKAFKKEFACNGTLVEDEELGQVIQLQGDQRQKISNFLIEEGIQKSTIKLHGF